MTVTIKDVARLAGVSISTVSRVINNSKPVSLEVRKKVLEIIEEIGYKPNEIARSLVTKKSFIIGVIVTDIGDSYVAEMVRGIEEIGKMYDYDILLCSTYGDKEMECRYLQLLKMKQVEGVILISDIINDKIDELIKEFNRPFVYLNRSCNNNTYHTVSIDNYKGAFEMTKHLLGLGHKNIAYVMKKEDVALKNITVENMKLNGYRDAMIEDMHETNIYITEGRNIIDGYHITKDILNSNKKITAIFCSNDNIAIGVVNYLYDNNVAVPEEISVAGFGDINMASFLRPKLTTISEPFYDIGAVAIRKIIKVLKGENVEDSTIILPFRIQKRNSCAEIK